MRWGIFSRIKADLLVLSGSPRTQELLDYLETEMDAKGLDVLMPGAFIANYARPRRFEVRRKAEFFFPDNPFIQGSAWCFRC